MVHIAMPGGLDFDAEGNLWFVERATGRLRYVRGGRVYTAPNRPELTEPCSLRFGTDGSMFITTCGNHRVLRVWPDGEWLPIAGSGHPGFSGDGEAALAGALSSPSDTVPMTDGSLLVADAGNDRIRRLTPNAEDSRPVQLPDGLQNSPVIVRHAATLLTGKIAPGQLVYVTMDGISKLNGVAFNGQPGTVMAAADRQLTVRAPMSIVPGPVEVWVTESSATRTKAVVIGVVAAPGILTAAGGTGQALASNEDGNLNGAFSPAPRSSVVTFYLTGEGDNTTAPKVRIGGYESEVVWYGRAPDMPGVFQVNVRTPGGFSPSGVVPVEMTVNGASTQAGVTIVSK